MSKLKEVTIQDRAVEELKKHYSERESLPFIYGGKEAWVRKEWGGKRADGLFCYKTTQGQYYTISMEAKSHKTLGSLVSFVNDDELGWHSLLTAVGTTMVMSLLIITLFEVRWWFVLLAAAPLFLMSLISAIALFDKLGLSRHKLSEVVKQYPANEQWIVYSKYADNLLAAIPSKGKKNHLQVLKQLCENNGFGLMLISTQKTHIVKKPKALKGNFLSYYCRESEVVGYLEDGQQKVKPSVD